ncbi:MAG TPA: hypothetical protein PKV97_12550 [Thauera aminoaromatica]|nr:hypothetical protein [Thauera aminoaromatica]
MSHIPNLVSIHPYFKIKPGKADEFKASLPAFIAKTATEKLNLFYDFTIHDDVVLCREGYVGAEGLLTHLDGVGPLLGPLMTLADLVRVEVHGPAAELEKLKGPLAALNPTWHTRLLGVER